MLSFATPVVRDNYVEKYYVRWEGSFNILPWKDKVNVSYLVRTAWLKFTMLSGTLRTPRNLWM